jgi:hypothetical protein
MTPRSAPNSHAAHRALCLAAVALTLAPSGCGDVSKADKQQARQIQALENAKRDRIERLIDADVVRSSPDGTTGKELVWDLNHNGRIDRAERRITERELYDATLRPE